MRAKITMTLAVMVVIAAMAAPVSAQIVYGQPTAGGASVIYSSWKLESDTSETTISQFYVPITGFIPVHDNFEILFSAANVGNTLDAGDEEYDLNGLSDVRLQASHSFSDDHLLLSAGVNIPTGKKELTFSEEYVVLDALSQNFLDFPSRRLGEGFGFSLMLGGATELGEGVRGGAGVMYEYIGKYTPYEGYEDYDPGDLISVNGGFDIERGAWLWSVEGIYSMYLADKVDGDKSFKQSPQFDIRVGSNRHSEKASFGVMLRYVLRGDNKSYNGDGAELDPFKLYGNELSAGAHIGWQISPSFSFTPNVQLRMISANDVVGDQLLDDAAVYGFGSGIGLKLSKSVMLDGGGRYYTGKADGDNIDLTGFQVSLGLTATM